MGLDRGNETTTQLLTLLNVSATKASKRKWVSDDSRPKEKLNKRRVVLFDESTVNITPTDNDATVEDARVVEKEPEDKAADATKEEGKEVEEEEDIQGVCCSIRIMMCMQQTKMHRYKHGPL